MADYRQIRVRRDTLANFIAAGVVPENGEPIAIENSSGLVVQYKIGDGVRSVDQLPALSKGDKGDKGEQGLPGTNGVATDSAVASNMQTDGTATKAALQQVVLATALPGPIPARVSNQARFDPRASVYNWKPGNTKRFSAARGSIASGGTCRIGMIGDSITAGVGATADTSAPAVVRQIAAQLTASTGRGQLWMTTLQTQGDDRYSESATGVSNTPDGPFNLSARVLADTGWAQYSDVMDAITIRWRKQENGANGRVTVDGTQIIELSGSSSADASIQKQTVLIPSGLGNHVVRITGTGASTTGFKLLAMEPVISNAGYQVSNLGRGSQTATTLADTPADVWSSASFDAVTVQIGVNDFLQSLGVAVFRSKLLAAVTAIRSAGSDVILVASTPTARSGDAAGFDAYLNAVYLVADSIDCPVIDLSHAWTDATTAVANGLFFDSPALHPNAKGYANIAARFVASLGIQAAGNPLIKTAQQYRATTLGTLVKKVPVYDQSGAVVGWLPVYDSIAATPVTVVSDDFARADSTTLGATAGGRTWVLQQTSGALGIVSNQAAQTTAASHNVATIDAAVSDCTVSIDFATIAGAGRVGLAFRRPGQSTGWLVRKDGLWKDLALHTAFGTALVSGDHIDVVLAGPLITVKKNGTQILQVSDATYQQSTKHGVYFDSDTASRLDNFAVVA